MKAEDMSEDCVQTWTEPVGWKSSKMQDFTETP